MFKLSTVLAFVALAAATPLGAQGRDRDRAPDDIPPAHRPPPGMCRVWVDGVPPGQQPAPTDCKTAIRNRPPNGRVIFGDDYVKQGGGKSNLPDLLKEFRRIKEKQGDERKDDEKESDKRKRYRKP
jgi:hypothetical protein